jgi:hypothetical protein
MDLNKEERKVLRKALTLHEARIKDDLKIKKNNIELWKEYDLIHKIYKKIMFKNEQ